MSSQHRVRRFAPLDPANSATGSDAAKLQGIIFDVDGTLCEPQNYMFGEMRSALGIDKGTDILEHIDSLPEPEQEPAMKKIRDIESQAMKKQTPQPGLTQLMDYLDKRGVQKAICTRNFDIPIEHLLTTFLPTHKFEPIITRAFKPPKPSPAGINHIATSWNLSSASNLIMVGDSIDDMTAGHKAGAATVLLVNPANEHLAEHEHTDLCVDRLDELIGVLDRGFVGREEELNGDDAVDGATTTAAAAPASKDGDGAAHPRGGLRIRGGPNKIIGVLSSAGRDTSRFTKKSEDS